LARHPRVTLHLTPAYSSWLNPVERSLAELTNRWLRRCAHRSTKKLVVSIRTWINQWNDDPRPCIWHRSADEILDTLADHCHRTNAQAC
jgi:transposase